MAGWGWGQKVEGCHSAGKRGPILKAAIWRTMKQQKQVKTGLIVSRILFRDLNAMCFS